MRGSLGLHLTDQVPDPSTLSQNAQKLITHHPWQPFKEQTGDGHRIGAVRERSQTQTPSGHWVKRDANTGRFMDVKTSDKTPFKGVRKER